MIYLSEAALKYAVNICDELPEYKVGITVPSHRAMGLTEKILEHEKRVQAHIFRTITIHGETRMLFDNGSVIEIFRPVDSVRGRAFHLVIVDRDTDRDFVYQVLLPTEKLDYYKVEQRT